MTDVLNHFLIAFVIGAIYLFGMWRITK